MQNQEPENSRAETVATLLASAVAIALLLIGCNSAPDLLLTLIR